MNERFVLANMKTVKSLANHTKTSPSTTCHTLVDVDADTSEASPRHSTYFQINIVG
jgi:hypothetical protein